MNELSEYLVMDRSTLGHNLRPLLRQGLVLLKPDTDDGRTRRVILTTKGAAKLSEGRRLWRTAQKEYEKMIGKGLAVKLRNALHGLTKLDAP
jgi:DNA-binding MarR family transcriptional regulator